MGSGLAIYRPIPHTGYMTTKMKFTPAQREILVALDGSFEPLSLPGTSKKPVLALHALGLVTYRVETKMVRTGTYPVRGQRRYVVRLTTYGSQFIYNGGIDS